MSINVPEFYEETDQIEINTGEFSVPPNGIPKVIYQRLVTIGNN